MKARLASRNEHKLRELAAALPGWELELIDRDDFPPESGATYYENARTKARFASELGDGWVLGEDSGIELDALGGAPGVTTARWAAGRHVERVLEALAGLDAGGRRAQYFCELVAIAPDGGEFRGTGTLSGSIAHVARGTEGFGFDPVFVPAGEERTVAELGETWKSANSHRARAAFALRRAVEGRQARPAASSRCSAAAS